jgi:hypothetical protein
MRVILDVLDRVSGVEDGHPGRKGWVSLMWWIAFSTWEKGIIHVVDRVLHVGDGYHFRKKER